MNEKKRKFFVCFEDNEGDIVLIDRNNKRNFVTDEYKYIRNIRAALKIFDKNNVIGLALCQVIDENHHNEIISK